MPTGGRPREPSVSSIASPRSPAESISSSSVFSHSHSASLSHNPYSHAHKESTSGSVTTGSSSGHGGSGGGLFSSLGRFVPGVKDKEKEKDRDKDRSREREKETIKDDDGKPYLPTVSSLLDNAGHESGSGSFGPLQHRPQQQQQQHDYFGRARNESSSSLSSLFSSSAAPFGGTSNISAPFSAQSSALNSPVQTAGALKGGGGIAGGASSPASAAATARTGSPVGAIASSSSSSNPSLRHKASSNSFSGAFSTNYPYSTQAYTPTPERERILDRSFAPPSQSGKMYSPVSGSAASAGGAGGGGAPREPSTTGYVGRTSSSSTSAHGHSFSNVNASAYLYRDTHGLPASASAHGYTTSTSAGPNSAGVSPSSAASASASASHAHNPSHSSTSINAASGGPGGTPTGYGSSTSIAGGGGGGSGSGSGSGGGGGAGAGLAGGVSHGSDSVTSLPGTIGVGGPPPSSSSYGYGIYAPLGGGGPTRAPGWGSDGAILTGVAGAGSLYGGVTAGANLNGASSLLISSLVQRLVNRLPCNSGRRLSSLETEELTRATVASLVDLARWKLTPVVRELVTALDGLNRGRDKEGSRVDESLPLDVLQSQLFMIKVLAASMIHHWKCESHGNDPTHDPAKPHRRHAAAGQGDDAARSGTPDGGPPLPRGWDDPPPLDETLAKQTLSVMTSYLRQMSAREDTWMAATSSGSGSGTSGVGAGGLSTTGVSGADSSQGTGGNSSSSADFWAHHSVPSSALSTGKGLFTLYTSYPPTMSPFSLSSTQVEDGYPSGDHGRDASEVRKRRLETLPSFAPVAKVFPLSTASHGESNSGDSLPIVIASIYRYAGMVVFYLSASNWAVVFARIRSKLTQLNQTPDENANVAELRLIECSDLNKNRLGGILQELCISFLHLKRSAQVATAIVLRRAIWNWIQYYPSEFASLVLSNRGLEARPEMLFDHVNNVTDSTKRRTSLWPMMTALVMLCPGAMNQAAVGEAARRNGGLGKKINFLESLRKALRSSKLSDLAALCYVDICKAATYTPPSETGLRLLVPDIDDELKEKLFEPSRPFINAATGQVDVALMVDLLVALYRLDPHKVLKGIVPVCTSEGSPLAFKLALVKACIVLVREGKRMHWYPEPDLLFPRIGKWLRITFKELTYRMEQQLQKQLKQQIYQQQQESEVAAATSSFGKRTLKGTGTTTGTAATPTPTPVRRLSDDFSGRSELLQAIIVLWSLNISGAFTSVSTDRNSPLRTLTANTGLSGMEPTKALKVAMEEDTMLSLLYTVVHLLSLPLGAAFHTAALRMLSKVYGPKPTSDEEARVFRSAVQSSIILGPLMATCAARQLFDAHNDAEGERQGLELLEQILSRINEWIDMGLMIESENEEAPFNPPRSEVRSATVAVEIALFLTICSADTEVCAAAMQCFGIHGNNREFEPRFTPQPVNEYRAFFKELADGSGVVTGRIAQQRRVRSLLRNLAVPSAASLAAWTEAYARWSRLKPVVVLPMTNDTSRAESQEKAARWHNFAGFLAALGGSCVIERQDQLPDAFSSAYLPAHLSKQEDPMPNIENFMQEMVDLLVSDSVWVREKVKEILGLDLNLALNGILFRQVHAVLSNFFDKSTGMPKLADIHTVFVEQSIGVVQLVLKRMDEPSEVARLVDIGSLMVLYVEYVNALGASQPALRVKISMCHLCETLMVKKDYFAFSNEVRVRNRLFQALVTWTSDLAEDASKTAEKFQRELDVACLKAISMLLDKLPLLLSEDALLFDDKVEWAKARHFTLYFQYFIKILNRARALESAESANRARRDPRSTITRRDELKDIEPLKEYAIVALSNLLASNIEAGLQHSLSMAYNDDPKIRTAFMQIMTNVLNQGTAFDDLERLSVSTKQTRLVELVGDPDMQLALSICNICRGWDVEPMDVVLLSIFDCRGGVMKFLKLALDEEVANTTSEELVFRSNSFRTHLLSVFARTHGYEYLRSILAPLIQEMTVKASKWSFEIDAGKLGSSDSAAVNQQHLEEMAQAFIDVICSSAPRVPAVLRQLCRHIRMLMDERFPLSRYQGVGGFMFLRFISPAVVAPQIIDINIPVTNKELRRGLLLISKILQTLASNNLFPSHKEPFMTGLNDFLKLNVWKITMFLDQVSDNPPDPQRVLAADEPLGYGIQPYGYGIDETDQRSLQKFLFENIDKIGTELIRREQSASSKNVDGSLGEGKRTYETLCAALAEMGDPQSLNDVGLSLGSAEGKEAYLHLIRRNAGRSVNEEAYKAVLYEGPPSKEGRPVLYYAARNMRAETMNFEGLLVYIFKMVDQFTTKQFDLVCDWTLMSPDHQTPIQWLGYFISVVPQEICDNLVHCINLSANTATRQYFRPMYSGWKAKEKESREFIRKQIFVNSLAELETYVERRNIALPSSTISIATAPIELEFTSVTMVWYYRQLIPVSFRIGGDYLQILALKKQEILPGASAYTHDVFHLADVDDVRHVSVRGDDNTFFVTCRGGTMSFLFNSKDRMEIVQALRQAKARMQRFRTSKSADRTLLPSDVPGTLLNMAMLNITSDDYGLRLSAYDLLCALSTSFNFGASNAKKSLLSVKGLALPANTIAFVTELSKDFAAAAPGVTLEFLLSFFEGFEKASTSQKAVCLHYMSPWLTNLVMFTHTVREQQEEYQKRIKEIIGNLLNITTKQPEIYATMQRAVWAQMSKLDNLIPLFLEVFAEAAMDSGLSSPRFEAILDTMVSFASINLRGKLLARLRRAIAKTAQNPMVPQLHENPAWKEIATLVRMNMMLSFTSRLEVLLYLPELLHVILLLAGNGHDQTRSSIYGTAINMIHSLCTDDARDARDSSKDADTGDQEATLKLRPLLNKFADGHFAKLFGLPEGPISAFDNNSDDIVHESPANDSIEELAHVLYEIAEIAAPTVDTANSWRARLTSLVTSTAFQYNPIIQTRAFLLLGCLAKGEIDDDLLYQVLVSLRGSISEWANAGNDGPMISIVTCLSKIVKILPDRSRYLPQMFWLGVAVIQYGHVPLFKVGVELLQATVTTLHERNLPAEEGKADMINFLLDARVDFQEAATALDEETGVDFEINFSFGMAALLIKGLRHPTTKDVTAKLLRSLLQYSAVEVDGTVRSKDGRISAPQLGFFVALLPISTKPEDFGSLLRMAGTDEVVCEQAVEARTRGFSALYRHLEAPENKLSLLVVTLVASLLQHAENDAERLLLFGFLADAAQQVPTIVSILYESLILKMRDIFLNCPSTEILEAVQFIAHTAAAEPVFAAQALETSKRGGPAAYLDESGYRSLIDCGAFTPLKESKRMTMAKLSTLLLVAIVESGT